MDDAPSRVTTETCTSCGRVYTNTGGVADGRAAIREEISCSVGQSRKSLVATSWLSGTRFAAGGRITSMMLSMLIHSTYPSCARSFASVFIGANGMTYCLCRICPPTHSDGTDNPVAPYCVKALRYTRLSRASASIAGVKVTAGL